MLFYIDFSRKRHLQKIFRRSQIRVPQPSVSYLEIIDRAGKSGGPRAFDRPHQTDIIKSPGRHGDSGMQICRRPKGGPGEPVGDIAFNGRQAFAFVWAGLRLAEHRPRAALVVLHDNGKRIGDRLETQL